MNGAGAEKAAVLNQRFSVRSPDCGSPTILGRSGPAVKAFVVFDAVTTVKGAPDCSVANKPTFHDPSTAFSSRLFR